jgi:hypothetical protein
MKTIQPIFRKIDYSFRLLCLVLSISLAASISPAFAQGSGATSSDITTTFDLTKVESGVKSVNKEILGIARKIIQGILFLFALWQLIEGYMNHSLQTKWLTIVGVGLFIGLLQIFPTIYQWITGYNAIE